MVEIPLKCLYFAIRDGVPLIFRRLILGTGVPNFGSVSLSIVPGNGTWPLGYLGVSGRTSASFKTQLFSENDF